MKFFTLAALLFFASTLVVCAQTDRSQSKVADTQNSNLIITITASDDLVRASKPFILHVSVFNSDEQPFPDNYYVRIDATRTDQLDHSFSERRITSSIDDAPGRSIDSIGGLMPKAYLNFDVDVNEEKWIGGISSFRDLKSIFDLVDCSHEYYLSVSVVKNTTRDGHPSEIPIDSNLLQVSFIQDKNPSH